MKILYEEHYFNNLKSFSEVYSISANYKKIKNNGYLVNRNVVLSFLGYFLVSAILDYVYLKFLFIEYIYCINGLIFYRLILNDIIAIENLLYIFIGVGTDGKNIFI